MKYLNSFKLLKLFLIFLITITNLFFVGISEAKSEKEIFKEAKKSQIKYNEHDLKKAILIYEEALELDRQNAIALAGLSESFSLLGRYYRENKMDYENEFNLSYRYITDALSKDNKNLFVKRALAYVYLNLSREKDALRIANEILEKDRKNIEALYISWAAQGKKVDDPRIKKVLKDNPKLIVAHVDLAKSYFHKKRRYSQAIEQIQAAISYSDSAYLRNFLGNAYRARYSLNNSIDAYKKSIDLDSNFAPAYINNGISLHYLGKISDSISSLKHGISLNDRFPESYYYLGLNYQKKKNYDDAIVNYKKFLEMAAGQFKYTPLINKAKQNMATIAKR